MDDHEWMYTGRANVYDCTDEWIEKTNAFLEQAFTKIIGKATWCPCSKSRNMQMRDKKVMGEHLGKYGFKLGYRQI